MIVYTKDEASNSFLNHNVIFDDGRFILSGTKLCKIEILVSDKVVSGTRSKKKITAQLALNLAVVASISQMSQLFPKMSAAADHGRRRCGMVRRAVRRFQPVGDIQALVADRGDGGGFLRLLFGQQR